jgi:hypothetical protein
MRYSLLLLSAFFMAGASNPAMGAPKSGGCRNHSCTQATPTPAPTATATPTPAPTATPMPSPTPSATPSTGYIKNGFYNSFVGPVFDYSTMIVPSGITSPVPYGPQEGKFRFTCVPDHEAYDDPIVFPGQPGKSHLHQFFGNRLANANSTYESLRNSGTSSCGSSLNRSAYWMPAMLSPDESSVIRPDIIVVYYDRVSDGATACTLWGIDCKPLPRGLRFVFGYNFTTGSNIGASWYCAHKDQSTSLHYNTLVEVATVCGVGDQIVADIVAGGCWDGQNLDTPDHRSHVTYGDYSSGLGYRCPASNPYVIPQYEIKALYTVDSGLDRSGAYVAGVTKTWHLSSDAMGKTKTPGESLHADWFGAWDDYTMDRWMKGCINNAFGGNNGDLCDGGRMPDAAVSNLSALPRLVPTPPMPMSMSMPGM